MVLFLLWLIHGWSFAKLADFLNSKEEDRKLGQIDRYETDAINSLSSPPLQQAPSRVLEINKPPRS